MAREFAQIKLSIWSDDDWRDLSPDARYLYMTLLTSTTLTHCGTADWRPARLSAVNGQDRETIEAAGAELVDALYLVIDEETEEVLIRSFIRNDGLMKQPKMAVAMASAHAGVASPALRGVIVHEANRLKKDHPDLHGWKAEKANDLLGLRSVDPSTYPLGKGSTKGKATPIGSGSTKGSPTPTPATTPTDCILSPSSNDDPTAVAVVETDHFDTFWNIYSKKVGIKAARAAWKRAVKKPGVTTDLLLNAAAEYIEWQQVEGKHPEFTKNPATWLNGEHWNDERSAREKARPKTKLDGFRDVHADLVARGFADPTTPDAPRQIGASK